MPLPTGNRLGVYEIVAAIGVGGMGEVYRARDTTLGRNVALKVLPEVFAQDPDRLARFRREAQVLASLNHPNIAQIHGFEDAGGTHALVMELVEGPTLADRIARGAIPVDEALPIAAQIADALEAAHDQGIVHRDLKPANIILTSARGPTPAHSPDGGRSPTLATADVAGCTVKVLDFGLAKALDPAFAPAFAQGATAEQALSQSPTITSPAITAMGIIMGTAAYMSPEQARGAPVDRRADIWAYGVVLYEMLSGRRLFDGENLTDVLASVVKDRPNFSGVPARFRKLLAACLEKDPRKRLQAIGDAKLLLADDAVAEPQSSRLSWGWIVAAGLVVGLGVALWAPWRTPSVPDAAGLSVVIAPPDGSEMWGVLSPDGSRLLVIAGRGPVRVLTFATGAERELPGTEFIRLPFWSPDGRWVAFFKDGNLLVTSSTGGPTQVICRDTGNFFGGAWHPNNTVLVASETGAIQAVKVVNGVAEGGCTSVQPDSPDLQAFLPEWLPDGEHFLYTAGISSAEAGVYLTSIHDPSPRRILQDASSVIYLPPGAGESVGHLFFRRGSRLMAQLFDAERGVLKDDPIELAGDVMSIFNPLHSSASVSSNGLLTYVTSTDKSRLTWMNRQGRELETVGPTADYTAVTVSPNGDWIGFRRDDVLSILRRTTGVETRADTVFSSLVVSADGSWFARWAPGVGLVRQPVGGGVVESLLPGRNGARPSQWTKDKILFTDVSHSRGDLWYLPNPGAPGSQPVRILATPASESQGQLSPDGHWLAYGSDEGGSDAVYVCRFPECSERQKLPGTDQPYWSSNGKELFWRRDEAIMAATVRAGATFTYDPPQVLFSAPSGGWTPALNFYSFAPSPDGQRFLVVLMDKDARSSMHLVTNWRRLLQKPGAP